jgi:hypothetical protein
VLDFRFLLTPISTYKAGNPSFLSSLFCFFLSRRGASNHFKYQSPSKMERGSHSHQLSVTSLAGVDPGGSLTLWALTKTLGRSATKKGSLAVKNGFPNPFGINEPESPPDVIEQAAESDPEKGTPVAKIQDGNLPPFDKGRRAWAFLLGAATIEGLMWGAYFPSRTFCLVLTNMQGFLWPSASFNPTFKVINPLKIIDTSQSLGYWQPYAIPDLSLELS